MIEQNSQTLIDAFFKALNLMQLDRCQTVLETLEKQLILEPAYRQWHIYLTGVLVNEQERNFAKAERIFTSLLDTELELALQQRVLIALGRTYDYLGRWSEALDVYQRCLRLFNWPDQKLDSVKIWKNMAITLEKGFIQGNFDLQVLYQAIEYCRNALKVFNEIDDPDEEALWLEATTWNTLGVIYKSLEDWSQATNCFRHFVDLSHRLGDRYNLGAAYHNLGEVLQRQDSTKWPEALQVYQQAREIYQEFYDIYNEIDLLANLGSLYREMDHPDTALNHYHQALDLAESIRARLTAPASQADYRTTIEKLYIAPVSIHLEQGQAEAAFSAVERARSRVLADLLAGQEARPQADLPGHHLEQRADLHRQLDQAYAAEEPPDNLPDIEKALADLDRQIELLDPSYAGLEAVAPLTAGTVCRHLPPETALLTYAGDSADRLWILVATPTGVQTRPVENLSVSWLRDYLTAHLDGSRRSGLLPKPQTGYLAPPKLFPPLYQALIAPVWDMLRTARTVYIIPFGPLHYLPLGALTPRLDQSPPLLSAGRRVVYAPSATILFNYCHIRPASSQSGLLAVAPGDDRLQFTRGAANTIAHRAGHLAMTGPAATRRAFLTEAGRYRIVCFLGHALFDQKYPMSSRLKLTDGSLHASEMLRELRLQADLVILSACETGRSHVLRGDEILGLSRAILYAGTPSLLVTLWPVHEIPTRLLVEKLVAELPLRATAGSRFDPAYALATTQNWLRTLTLAEVQALMAEWETLSATDIETQLTALWQMTHPQAKPQANSQPFTHPFFWSPYILIGEQKTMPFDPDELLEKAEVVLGL